MNAIQIYGNTPVLSHPISCPKIYHSINLTLKVNLPSRTSDNVGRWWKFILFHQRERTKRLFTLRDYGGLISFNNIISYLLGRIENDE